MPIPTTRAELVDMVSTSYTKLEKELKTLEADQAALPCVDAWTIKDLLAVRAWWTERVVDWIEAGPTASLELPAAGYRWSETPRLNAAIVKEHAAESYESLRERLTRGVERVLATIDALDDRALLEIGVFGWAGKWPIARWISINTARQYTTARTYVRRAVRCGKLGR
ncbi:MAG: ClbS/DfsB family four-helix bundle protein [Gemmatimonadota bacterium]|nr:ClbS/DfsB family four-helix bundle protein [Gemmatimonadota bacterium]MDH3477012.1 ClbS/DfsB family four-helix bundle protein [Gemmatimonadota bacterium]MDH3569116.1 ClbS/DfsB family four-helix bundle protein [Gemmatimonadota bacterium]MDH5548973.1 ClbS/DfsB family four-helix bundle protein [Gemmatimonadota bacterium]